MIYGYFMATKMWSCSTIKAQVPMDFRFFSKQVLNLRPLAESIKNASSSRVTLPAKVEPLL